MTKFALRICSLVSTVVLASAAICAQTTGTPFFNVMSFGATCDGNPTHDDTPAFNAAITAAKNAHGGIVAVPSTTAACVISTQLSLAGLRNAKIIGLAGPTSDTSGQPIIVFEGSTGPAIDGRNTSGLEFENLSLRYYNSLFTGNFMDIAGSDTIRLNGVMMEGLGAANGATCLLSMDQTQDIVIEKSNFNFAHNAICGASASGFANAVTIRNSTFNSSGGVGTISNYIFKNFGQSWTIGPGNSFEMYTDAHIQGVMDGSTVSCTGCRFFGNWIGDDGSNYSGTMFQKPGLTSFENNVIYGTSLATLMSLGGGEGITFTGNYVSTFATAFHFDYPYPTGPLNVLGNAISVTQFTNAVQPSGMTDDASVTPNGGLTIWGNLTVDGQVSKGGGAFKIDHPLDPANKFLQHSFVESPDMMNIYNGVAKLDSRGRALIKLPAYFEALNQDFRYQLTPLGSFAPLYVAQKVKNNSFRIAGGRPGMEVSWQVTGIRHDAYANAHRIVVEEQKPEQEKGHYLYPALFAHPANEAVQVESKPKEPTASPSQGGHQ